MTLLITCCSDGSTADAYLFQLSGSHNYQDADPYTWSNVRDAYGRTWTIQGTRSMFPPPSCLCLKTKHADLDDCSRWLLRQHVLLDVGPEILWGDSAVQRAPPQPMDVLHQTQRFWPGPPDPVPRGRVPVLGVGLRRWASRSLLRLR
jgi:hypothetical protein